ncbi:Hypothetical predicted protein, partial [Pelobates cultripes]
NRQIPHISRDLALDYPNKDWQYSVVRPQIPKLLRPWRWHLSPWILRDQGTIQTLTANICDYFDTNSTEDVAPAMVWTAHKAAIRGNLIATATNRKQHHLQNLTAVLAELARLE